MSFAGKVALITGASSGIGAEAARHLAKLGAKVSLVGRNEKRLKDVAEQIVKAGSAAPVSIVADVTKDSERIIGQTVEKCGKLDVLVNNAGIFDIDTVVDFDVNKFDRLMNTNLRSVIILTNLAVPHLEKTKGNIVNVSSVAGLRGFDIYTSYCISKAGLNQFTKCAALALASKGIRVNALNPAMVKTNIFAALGVNETNQEAFFDSNKKEYLVGRVGETTDTAAAIEYLASQTFVNGICLPVDGGLMCSGISGNFVKPNIKQIKLYVVIECERSNLDTFASEM